ncbi:cobalamin-binding protein, partial [Vibrio parahaemolyticus]|nr:cobalamin-binding protein [Vibrio parahaemolyticus]
MNKLCFALTLFVSTATFAQPAQRIISLAPHATEIAFAAGLGEQLVAVSEM